MRNVPRERGSEEYRILKIRDQHRDLYDPASLRPFISRVNAIRRATPALQSNDNLMFTPLITTRSFVTASEPRTTALILTVVNLDPAWTQSGFVELPLRDLGIDVRHPYK